LVYFYVQPSTHSDKIMAKCLLILLLLFYFLRK